MAHKSHRQKALQSQLEERPAISLITNEEKPKKKVTKKVKPSTTASALASSGSMDVDEPTSTSTQPQPEAQHVEDDDGDILIDNATASTSNTAMASTSTSSGFAPLALGTSNGVLKNEFRRITVPAHRMSPLRRDWVAMYTPMVEHLGLQVRMNEKRRCVEIRVSLLAIELRYISIGPVP